MTEPLLTPGAMPTVTVLEGMRAFLGVSLPPHRVVQASTAYQRLGPLLTELRSVQLPFLEDVPEPASSNQWIENGGIS